MIPKILLLGAMLAASSAMAAEPMRFTSAAIDLPMGDRTFPGGPEAEAINNNCLACHSAGMVLTQPAPTPGEWKAVVDKMIHTYEAPIAEDDAQAIVRIWPR